MSNRKGIEWNHRAAVHEHECEEELRRAFRHADRGNARRGSREDTGADDDQTPVDEVGEPPQRPLKDERSQNGRAHKECNLQVVEAHALGEHRAHPIEGAGRQAGDESPRYPYWRYLVEAAQARSRGLGYAWYTRTRQGDRNQSKRQADGDHAEQHEAGCICYSQQRLAACPSGKEHDIVGGENLSTGASPRRAVQPALDDHCHPGIAGTMRDTQDNPGSWRDEDRVAERDCRRDRGESGKGSDMPDLSDKAG
jgi:hypothetical protein